MKEYILGLDISTSVIGLAVMDKEANLVHYQNIRYKSGIELEKKAFDFKEVLRDICTNYPIHHVYVEQPAMMFGGGKTTAATMSKLQRFNGMCCYAVFDEILLIPELVHVNSARKKMNISIPRIVKNKKAYIIQEVEKKYPNFTYELTRQGNPKPGTDDIADAIVVAHYGVWMIQEGENDNGKGKSSK